MFSQIEKNFIRRESWFDKKSHEAMEIILNKPSNLEEDINFKKTKEMFAGNDTTAIEFLGKLYPSILDSLEKLDKNDSAALVLA